MASAGAPGLVVGEVSDLGPLSAQSVVMSQESTIPFVPASPAPEGVGGADGGDGGETTDVMLDAPPGVPVPAETVLDHHTPAPLGRGRTRERERDRDRAGHSFPLRQHNPVEGDLAAAAAAVAALHAATGPEAAVSVDALRTHECSPEKKAKLSSGTKMPPPAFGGLGELKARQEAEGQRVRGTIPHCFMVVARLQLPKLQLPLTRRPLAWVLRSFTWMLSRRGWMLSGVTLGK